MSFTVLASGALALPQDQGRFGYGALGVSESGAADGTSHALANRLVGNSPDAATCEVLLGGLSLRTDRPCTIAAAGAPTPVSVDGRVAAFCAPVHLDAGQVATLGAPTAGLRTYLAVRGGFESPLVLGSRASDPTTGLGGAALRPGDVVEVGTLIDGEVPLVDVPPTEVSATDLVLTAAWGPRDDWFAPAARATLTNLPWAVTADTDRVGTRLDGTPLQRERAGELPSEGMVRGAVQVPPDGRPIVFGSDHPTTGGYPVIAVVDAPGVDALAQARPGTRVRFVLRRLSL